MKKKLFAITSCVIGGLAMVLPVAISSIPEIKHEAPVEVLDDPVVYDEGNKTVRLDLVPNRAEEASTAETPTKVKLHYHNDDNHCLNRRFYTWVTGIDGLERMPINENQRWTATDMEIELDYNEITDYQGSTSLFFIIKMAGTWAGQSADMEITYADWEIVDGVLELWTVPGEGNSVEIYATKEETEFPKIKTAKFTDWNTIECVCTVDPTEKGGKAWVPTDYTLYAFDKTYVTMSPNQQKGNKEFYKFKTGTPTSNVFEIKFNYTAKINVQYVIESHFAGFDRTQKIVVSCENLYKTDRFEQFYTYKGDDLGATYSPTQTTFKVWSPISSAVTLNLYRNGAPSAYGGSDLKKTPINMFYSKGGVWEITVLGDLHQQGYPYYTYTFNHSAGSVEAMDPYAKACGLNGVRGYVYDPKSTEANPEGWDTVPAVWDNNGEYDIGSVQDLSIYEIHIRDLTMDETWQPKNQGTKRGTYVAFAESGTTYSENGKTVSTGYDHIKDLGVKAIQLLPVFDQDNDERPEKMKFNWGYNPLNYNCVEGGYSTDPSDPLARIREYKSLIKAYSEKRAGREDDEHTRVIMDVVYNHVSSASASCFTKSMPKYYFRYTPEWAYYDGSGCSNEVQTDATMMRKYIVDSLVWWATEYKIKGFRFDLMGLIDSWTMREVKDALYNIDPDIYVYGEGWTSGGYHGKYEKEGNVLINGGSENDVIYRSLAGTGYGGTTSAVVGGFNNGGRDSLRGGNDHGDGERSPYPGWGFISKGGDVGTLSYSEAAMIRGQNPWVGHSENPSQTVNYASCHDNYTLWDQLRYTLAPNGYYTNKITYRNYEGHTITTDNSVVEPIGTVEPEPKDLIPATLAAHGLIFASNSAAFIQGGEELYRTKTYTQQEVDELYDPTDPQSILRPFSRGDDYVTYTTDPNQVMCTAEVWMYGKVTTHNSYKSSDHVNSFKWNRKIMVDNYPTYEYNEIWKKMIRTHAELPKLGWPHNLDNNGNPNLNFWDVGDGSNALSMWFGNEGGTKGYYFFFSGRNDACSNGCGDLGACEIVYKTKNYTYNDGRISGGSFSFVCARKGY